jgi:ribonucleoside-diphosphate reductase alpha chain
MDGRTALCEVFVRWGKQGPIRAGLMDVYAIALTAGLQCGVPLADLLQSGLGLCFVPNGHTDDPEIPPARSVIDYFCRRLAVDWLPYTERARLGIFTISRRMEQAGLAERADEPAPQPLREQSVTLRDDAARLFWELATSVAPAR